MDRAIILKKHEGVGVDEISICWIRSYLTGYRYRCMWQNFSLAACHKVLFLSLNYTLYINDKSAAVKYMLLLHADDSVLLA